MSAALAECLRPVQDKLAELEREYRRQANDGNAPDAWATWCDLHAAPIAVRAAQGRDARARGHEVSEGGAGISPFVPLDGATQPHPDGLRIAETGAHLPPGEGLGMRAIRCTPCPTPAAGERA